MRRPPAELMLGLAWVGTRALVVGRGARSGLVQVLVAADPPPAWRSKWRRASAYAAVALVTVVLGLPGLAGVFGPLSGVEDVQALLTIAAILLVIRYPLMSWRLAWLAMLLAQLVNGRLLTDWPWNPVELPVLLATFCVAGARHPRAVTWWMWALSVLPLWLSAATGHGSVTARLVAMIAFAAAAIAVDSTSSRRHVQRDLAEQTELTELEQARRAVLTERARIARELHDVVAHHMSLIAVRAETAPYRLSDIDDPVLAEFQALSGAAREALTDMRRLLGVLRDHEPAGRAPQPQLSDLPLLVESARHAGLPVELSLPAGLDQVPPAVGVCAYRIVQESLSNASRHAQGAAVTVSVDRDGDAVSLRVRNGPGGPADPAEGGHGAGQGLAGMQERVALLGGLLSAGPAADGGFLVAAILPLGTTVVARAERWQPA